MVKRMLIDATNPVETRVVVTDGDRLEEFDYETAGRGQIKGNIYLAKVTRVEPSLQAAFVDYGGNRHGFLPFSEIHPDYYRIPIGDRQALLAQENAQLSRNGRDAEADEEEEEPAETGEARAEDDETGDAETENEAEEGGKSRERPEPLQVEQEVKVDTLEEDDQAEQARARARFLRRYKIQEVVKRRQVMLVQVTKEERGNKGAALTTYLSLAGRYCVLMPNTAKGGGISRKIANAGDRKRLKKVVSELEIPEGMAVIVRTAGSERTKAEIRRDYEYLMRLWNEIRETTLQSVAPAVVHEEANLIKRAIRDLYHREMEEVLVAGEEGYKAAKSFMRSLTPSHARKVKVYKEDDVPLFHRFGVERQLDAMHSAEVKLRSGGYVVMNPTEALVAIDVNSGKATRERHIEETALKTNLEAAEEIARQLRLRDLAGLVVIDFIDMEEGRHNREVERRLKEAMRGDRARIQLGRISPFGLLELSRQRLRPSMVETFTDLCPICHGTGRVRSIASSALHGLRALEEEGLKRRGGQVRLSVPTEVALHILNELRPRLLDIEERYGFRVLVERDDDLIAPDFDLEHESAGEDEEGVVVPFREPAREAAAEREEERGRERQDSRRSDRGERAERTEEEEEGRRGRRRRPRRRRRDEERATEEAPQEEASRESEDEEPEEETAKDARGGQEDTQDEAQGDDRNRRRRGRRGGRRRNRRRQDEGEAAAEAQEDGEDRQAESEKAEGDGEAPRRRRPRRRRTEEIAEAVGEAEAEIQPVRQRAKRVAGAAPWESSAVTVAASPGPKAIVIEVEPHEGPAAEEADAQAAVEAVSEPEDLTAPGRAPESTSQSAIDALAEPEDEADLEQHTDVRQEPEPAMPEPAMAEAEAPAKPAKDKPRKRGWWQRLVSDD